MTTTIPTTTTTITTTTTTQSSTNAFGSVHFSEFSSEPIDIVEGDFDEQRCLYVQDDDLDLQTKDYLRFEIVKEGPKWTIKGIKTILVDPGNPTSSVKTYLIPAYFYRQVIQNYETAAEYQKTHPNYIVNSPLYRRFKSMVKILQGEINLQEMRVNQYLTTLLIEKGRSMHVAEAFCCFAKQKCPLLYRLTGNAKYFQNHTTITKSGAQNLTYFIVSEFIDFGTLKEAFLTTENRMAEQIAMNIKSLMFQTVFTFYQMHAQDIVHGDVYDSNLLVKLDKRDIESVSFYDICLSGAVTKIIDAKVEKKKKELELAQQAKLTAAAKEKLLFPSSEKKRNVDRNSYETIQREQAEQERLNQLLQQHQQLIQTKQNSEKTVPVFAFYNPCRRNRFSQEESDLRRANINANISEKPDEDVEESKRKLRANFAQRFVIKFVDFNTVHGNQHSLYEPKTAILSRPPEQLLCSMCKTSDRMAAKHRIYNFSTIASDMFSLGIVFSEMMIYIFRKENVRLLFDASILENEDPSAVIVSKIVDEFKSKNLNTENNEFSSSKMKQGGEWDWIFQYIKNIVYFIGPPSASELFPHEEHPEQHFLWINLFSHFQNKELEPRLQDFMEFLSVPTECAELCVSFLKWDPDRRQTAFGALTGLSLEAVQNNQFPRSLDEWKPIFEKSFFRDFLLNHSPTNNVGEFLEQHELVNQPFCIVGELPLCQRATTLSTATTPNLQAPSPNNNDDDDNNASNNVPSDFGQRFAYSQSSLLFSDLPFLETQKKSENNVQEQQSQTQSSVRQNHEHDNKRKREDHEDDYNNNKRYQQQGNNYQANNNNNNNWNRNQHYNQRQPQRPQYQQHQQQPFGREQYIDRHRQQNSTQQNRYPQDQRQSHQQQHVPPQRPLMDYSSIVNH